MALLSDSAEYDRALQRAPFSNGFEGQCWTDRWCDRCGNNRNDECPLLTVALLGRTPQAWVETHPGGLADRYTCAEFRGE